VKSVLLTLCLIFILMGCESAQNWDLLVHMEVDSAVQTFSIEGFETKKDCETAGLQQYEMATRLCVAREVTF
jgi:hypothetical protein